MKKILAIMVLFMAGNSLALTITQPDYEKLDFSSSELEDMTLDSAIDLILSVQGEEWLKTRNVICVLGKELNSAKGEFIKKEFDEINGVSMTAQPNVIDGKLTYNREQRQLTIKYKEDRALTNECDLSITGVEKSKAREVAKAFIKLKVTPVSSLKNKLDEWFSIDNNNLTIDAMFMSENLPFENAVLVIDQYIKSIKVEDKPFTYELPKKPLKFTYSQKITARKNGEISRSAIEENIVSRDEFKMYHEESSLEQKIFFSGKSVDSKLNIETTDKNLVNLISGIFPTGTIINNSSQPAVSSIMTMKNEFSSGSDDSIDFPFTIGKEVKSNQIITNSMNSAMTINGKLTESNSESHNKHYESCMPIKSVSVDIQDINYPTVVLKCAFIFEKLTPASQSPSKVEYTTISKGLVSKWIGVESGIPLKQEMISKTVVSTGLVIEPTMTVSEVSALSF